MLRTTVSVGAVALAITFAQPAVAQRVKAGVVTLIELGEKGWTIVRP